MVRLSSGFKLILSFWASGPIFRTALLCTKTDFFQVLCPILGRKNKTDQCYIYHYTHYGSQWQCSSSERMGTCWVMGSLGLEYAISVRVVMMMLLLLGGKKAVNGGHSRPGRTQCFHIVISSLVWPGRCVLNVCVTSLLDGEVSPCCLSQPGKGGGAHFGQISYYVHLVAALLEGVLLLEKATS